MTFFLGWKKYIQVRLHIAMDICGLQILIYLMYEIDSLDTLAVLKLLKYGHSFHDGYSHPA